MKQLKLIMLFCIGTLFIASKSFGQANPFINVLPSNSGIVSVGATIDIVVTIGNTGPISTIPQAKLRPIIQVPSSVTFLANAQQVGLPAGWTILSNTGSQLRLCNSADPIPVSTSRTIILKVQGVTVTPPQTFAGNINFGNGTTCSAGTSVAGDLTTDNSATSTVQVVTPVTTLNLNVFIEGYWNSGSSGMLPTLSLQGQPNPVTDCDSIDVSLVDSVTLLTVQSVRALLHTDGTASCVFPSVSGSYYIVVKNRSAVQTWSASPVAFGAIPTSYDFTTAEAQAYGAGGSPTAQKEVAPGVWAIYSGDVAVDENVDLLDLGLLETDVSDFVFGYNYDISNTNYPGVVATDLNGDGNVDLLDSPILENNISNFIFSNHP